MTGFQILFQRTFVKNAPQKEQAVAPSENGLLQLLGYIITNKLAVNSTMDTSLKNKIFVDVFLVENMSMLL